MIEQKKVIEKSMNNSRNNEINDNFDERKFYKTLVKNSGNYL